MKPKNPLLSFEFADSHGEIQPLTFDHPIKTFVAYTVDEVLSCFQIIEEAVDNGYYAAGFLSYESAVAFEAAYKVKESTHMPLLWFGIFSEPTLQALSSSGEYSLSEWKPSVNMVEYRQAITSIKQYIKTGVTYQTNYTIRLHSHFQGDDIAFFERLKKAQASKYCVYIHTGEHSILSASPELFFHLEADKITTRPMKGTAKRGRSSIEDEANANWLYHSEKNRSENVMIVDLLRNDLGMIAEPGTVSVEKLFEIEQYPTVHQMTSTISARISDDTKLVDIFRALFPCGSITGAPKISTMNIIAELETEPRDVYCGAIGYITPNKEAIFNVPIRTVLIDHQTGKATYGVGGGVTWDSTSEGEYEEILAKARLLKEERKEFHLLESLSLEKGDYFLLEEHLQRIGNTAKYFGFHCNLLEVHQCLFDFAKKNPEGMIKVRLLVARDGEVKVEGQTIGQHLEVVKAILANKPINKDNPFLYHKTTNRDLYTKFQLQKPEDVFDVLLWNQAGELTEFTNGNVVLEMDGLLWTPPIRSGLLAGTFRNHLIETGVIREQIVTIDELKQCTRIWFINSVRKWVEVELIK